jgi:hypothetical protein
MASLKRRNREVVGASPLTGLSRGTHACGIPTHYNQALWCHELRLALLVGRKFLVIAGELANPAEHGD